MSTLTDPSARELALADETSVMSRDRVSVRTRRPLRTRNRRTIHAKHLPLPPSDAEKYTYFGVQHRWTFLWLFVAEVCLVAGFAAFMIEQRGSAWWLLLLTLVIPPILVNLWLNLRRRRISLEDHIVFIEDWRRGRKVFPSVNVFVTARDSDPDVLENTFRHVSQIEWPGDLSVFVVDVAGRPTTRSAAERWGIHYLRGDVDSVRALEGSRADCFAVFDQDSAPRTDFLWETVPYLAVPGTGVVQTAQYFDIDSRVNEFARSSAALQELVSRWRQPARDTYDAAVSAHTNVLYRRHAIDTGGLDRVLFGVDAHDGVAPVAGYGVRYLPVALAKGLAPDSWEALTTQQYRLSRSSLRLGRSAVSRTSPLRFAQRLCYWAASLSSLAAAATVLAATVVPLAIVWLLPTQVAEYEYAAIVPALLAMVAVFPVMARGWRPTVIRTVTINAFCYLQATLDAAIGVKRTGDAVPKRVAAGVRTWFFASQALLWSGLGYDTVVGIGVVGLWPIMALSGVALIALAPTLVTLRPAGSRGQKTKLRAVPPVAVVANPVFLGRPRSVDIAS